ncbi:hypothetical protein GGR50DRAFT_698991 [Xylaria sp. CBS 124048]|nr:hypothetical protein GGR50DRAFT_698991 [Xylaria sp. CBS 124048]
MDEFGKDEYLVFASRIKGPKPLGFWSFNGVTLIVPHHPDNPDEDDEAPPHYKDPFALTSVIMEVLRNSENAVVREIVESNPRVTRLLTLKRRRDNKGNIKRVGLSDAKTQQATALAAHLCLPAINRQQCEGCLGNKGPFAECVSFGPKFFRGACSCCAYNSTGSTCTFHDGNKGSDYARMTDQQARSNNARAPASSVNLPIVTNEMMQRASLPYLDRLAQRAANDLARREQVAKDNVAKRARTVLD